MKTKTMVRSIVTTMVVMLVFASTAMAITVDGRDPGEWDPTWKLADDEDISSLDNGYDLLEIWQHYDSSEDKLYFKYVTDGIAGDSNSAGEAGYNDPNLPDDDYNDQWGVGDQELYTLALNVDGDTTTGINIRGYPGFDITIKYMDNAVTVEWHTAGITEPAGFAAEAAIATIPEYTHVVEFSVSDVTDYMNPRLYEVYGYAGSLMDEDDEDPLSEPIEVMQFDFDCAGICCFNMSFTGYSCGSIVNHTWTFGDGSNSGVISGTPEDAPFLYHQYSSGGNYDVTLSGYNTRGAYAEVTKTIYVDIGPTAVATANPIEIDGTTTVTFSGGSSYTDPNGVPRRSIVSYDWSFSDGTTASGEVVTKTVTNLMTPLTATLTVSDSHCIDDASVTVTKKEGPTGNEVPILTPVGIVALVGLLGIAGGIRLLNRGKRS